MAFWKKHFKKRPVKHPPKPIIKPPTITFEPRVQSDKQRPPQKETTLSPKPKTESKEKIMTRPKRIDYEKEFLNTFRQLTYKYRAWDIWRDFVVMEACALSNPVDKTHYEERESRYLKIIKKYKTEEQQRFPKLFAYMVMALEENPEQDFLGHIFMTLDFGEARRGQVFTPYDVCKLMAAVSVGNVVDQVRQEGYITINDCCCGGGATLIAAINEARTALQKENLNFQNHILVVSQDIDETVALMCYIQLSLLGAAAYIKVGNSLTEPMCENDTPMCENDTMENYWFTPMYFSDVWSTRRLVRKMDDVLKGENKNEEI